MSNVNHNVRKPGTFIHREWIAMGHPCHWELRGSASSSLSEGKFDPRSPGNLDDNGFFLSGCDWR